MLDIISNLNSNKTWTHITSFITSEGIVLVLYKRNILTFAKFSQKYSVWHYEESSVQAIDNTIISIAYMKNQILILDSQGHIFHYNTSDSKYSINEVGHIPCERLLAGCMLQSSPVIVCVSCDSSQNISIQSYNLESKSIKSCPLLNIKNNDAEYYLLRTFDIEGSEMILIGCADGSIVECSSNCSHLEIIHQCSEPVVEIFKKDDILYFVQADGCLLEYNNRSVSMKYLPQSVPKHCLFMPPSNLVYCDDQSTFLYDVMESSVQELRVKGVLDFCHSEGVLFLLTIQGMVYALQDTTSEVFLSKIQQFESLNQQLDKADSEISAIAIYTRAQQLKCRFMTRLCITQGELESIYKFKLDLTHSCEGVTFEKDSWSCYVGLGNHNIVLPLGSDLGPGDIVSLTFALDQCVPASYANIKIDLISGPHSELRVSVSDSVLTLLAFCSPCPPLQSPLLYRDTIPLTPDQCGNILDRALLDIRHTFTEEAWNKVAIDKRVTLQLGKDRIELCADERSRELLVKSNSEEVCHTVARIVKAGFISAGFLYSDYLHLNSIKQQAEIEEFENDGKDLKATTSKVNQLKSI